MHKNPGIQEKDSVDLLGPVRHDAGGRSKPRWPAGSVVHAEFSPDDQYRYALSEVWDSGRPRVMWLLMNPSVASVVHADPTLIRTGTFSRKWGCGGQLIGNVYAYRATDSRRLLDVDESVGRPENDAALLAMAAFSATVVLAYGQLPRLLRARATEVVRMLADAGCRLTYLRLAKDGTPMHPLYLPGSLTPKEYV